MKGPIKKSLRHLLEGFVRAERKIDWDDAPRLDLSGVPEAEMKDASLLAFHLISLASYVHQFWHAIRLMDHCEELDDEEEEGYPATAWTEMAARDAAFTVYHFRATLHAILHCVTHCPSISPSVRTKALEGVTRQFSKEFPYAKEVRHAAGHVADRMFKPAELDKHGLEDGGVYAGAVWHRALIFSYEKKIVGLDISEKNLDRLIALKSKVYAAFADAPTHKPKA
jgi:hypothetical protein